MWAWGVYVYVMEQLARMFVSTTLVSTHGHSQLSSYCYGQTQAQAQAQAHESQLERGHLDMQMTTSHSEPR